MAYLAGLVDLGETTSISKLILDVKLEEMINVLLTCDSTSICLSDGQCYTGHYRTDQSMMVDPKIYGVTFGARAFFKAAPVLWNCIPPSLRASASAAQFKKNLKTHLCHKIYNCSC